MTRKVLALLKEPPVGIGDSVISSQGAILALGEPTQRTLLAGRSRNIATCCTSTSTMWTAANG